MKKCDELVKNYVDAYINYVNTVYDLYKAKKAIDDFDSGDTTNSSESDVEPKRELFGYYYEDFVGCKDVGIVKAYNKEDAKNTLLNNYGGSTEIHIKKIEFNDFDVCGIYYGV